ncbi:amidohydrolase family protein [Reyranella sp. MMS21-HV4-11]|uniref:Amidohydrolase family protein n=1 Tax=Reyranella humidisoli TaxID=2849149 RepID=A0ABS6ICB2_9HYPH|nr:amidohydrolase family protein [Reyranella sp. MMS21-HV4-11]MBU8872247.1 amidohydrolase family protein [Reyranella sp. MMS21-HV4-11]
MFDLVIRNGTVIDGSGASRRVADVAVQGNRIAAVEPKLGAGKREIDAEGLIVAPGFVDIHTHYDGQATWDPFVTPSSWHGVTTTVFGNCGVGFAPVRPGASGYLINLMEGVEDIPGTVLSEGVKFNWESFPDYLDALASMDRAVDVAAQLPHGALRFYVMGDRGADHAEVPTEREIEEMARLTEEALHAGAMGFTTSRTTKHKARDGRFTPSLSAREAELLGIAQGMKRAGRGVLQVNSDFGPGEFEALDAAARLAGRPLSCLLVQVDAQPRLWRETLDQINAVRRTGRKANAQVGSRPIGVIMGLETTAHPFAGHRAWLDMRKLSPEERYQRLVSDSELRKVLTEGKQEPNPRAFMAEAFDRMFPIADRPDYEPDSKDSIASIAQRTGRTPHAVALEEMMSRDGKGLLMLPFENYAYGNLDVVHEMITDPASVLGIADGGAHVGVICDASSPTSLLTLWGRDRTRGPKLDLEFLIAKQTRGTAEAYGLMDRGLLAPGHKADINIIDFDNLSLKRPEVAYDLPTGGRRLIQRASGYRHTFNAGVETMQNDELTGERPGRLVRGAQTAG